MNVTTKHEIETRTQNFKISSKRDHIEILKRKKNA